MHRVPSSDGVAIAVHDLGGDGDALLLCHATGFCGRAYQSLANAAIADVHVWDMEFRGRGDAASPANERFQWHGTADDLDAAVDSITTSPVAIFGHSMGGRPAMLVERRRPG